MPSDEHRNGPLNTDPTRTGLSRAALTRAFLDNLFYIQGRFPDVATDNDYYQALAYTVRDRMLQRWVQTAKTYKNRRSRTVCFFSAEYLPGPHLGNNILNLGIEDRVRDMCDELGLDLDTLLDREEEPGLGNGGLGRLAACYMDSLATLRIPTIGYGIRYEFGLFDQKIRDGWQIESTDKWLHAGNPWEVARAKLTMTVKFGGHTVQENGAVQWIPQREVNGLAYDTPVLGYRVNNANLLRLWSAEAPESFDVQAFNRGNYYEAVDQKLASENLTKVLYPNDEPEAGRRLRLEQQYFFVSCSLQDMIRIYRQTDDDLERFHEKYVVQLNDTHPAIAVVELMRLLVDENGMAWATAWDISTRTFAYTNHTLLPEALEKWPVALVAELLPRHLEIIYEINRRFLDEVRLKYPWDDERIRRMSLIDESGERSIRMSNLACVGSSAINGVAKMHTELLKTSVLKDFFELWPAKFSNKTNGVTPRRFVALNNPSLRRVLDARVGNEWPTDIERLRILEEYADDAGFHTEWREAKQANKRELAAYVRQCTGILIDPETLFDIQVKRIHEYKRQHLNVLHIIALYNLLKQDSEIELAPRTFIFGGKAAPGYFMAKLIIKLIHSVADVVNRDPDVRDRITVVFFPDFNVKQSRWIYSAADLSEQLSTAGTEASGTGNMKFAMNGALTIGTPDGANVEIRDQVGAENFFLFGLGISEAQRLLGSGYEPHEEYRRNTRLKESIDLLASGYFSHGDSALFQPLIDTLLNHDPYLVLADYQSYVDCQKDVGKTFLNPEHWTRMSILNSARMGKFSSDRSIREYCQDIWHVGPVAIEMHDLYPPGTPIRRRAEGEKGA